MVQLVDNRPNCTLFCFLQLSLSETLLFPQICFSSNLQEKRTFDVATGIIFGIVSTEKKNFAFLTTQLLK